MNILHFPLVVQDEILKLMNQTELFVLSLCSKKARNLVKIRRFNDIIGVQFVLIGGSFQVFLHRQNNEFSLLCEGIHLNSGDLIALSDGERFPYKKKSESSDVLVDLYHHVMDLFSRSKNLKFTLSIDRMDNYRQFPSINRLRFIVNPITVKEMEQCIQNHPETETLWIQNQITGNVSFDSKIFGIKNLMISISVPKYCCTEYLRNFTGNNLKIQGPVEQYHLQYIIRCWLRGDYSENLKTFHVVRSEKVFTEDLLKEFEVVKWDLTEMPQYYPYDPIDAAMLSIHPFSFDCSEAFFIEREIDGKIASIKFIDRFFIFCVWN